jgi:hypothetical protein
MRRAFVAASVLGLTPALVACRDLSSFTTSGGSFEGAVVSADFVRAGVDASTRLCLTLNADHLQDAPGVLSTSDGRFHSVAMRTIPQIWQDPLSTLTFGEGRLKNLVYVLSASQPFADGNGSDVFAVVSLMQSGGVEVRLLRGAPPSVPVKPDAAAPAPPGGNLFAVFALSRQSAPCSY